MFSACSSLLFCKVCTIFFAINFYFLSCFEARTGIVCEVVTTVAKSKIDFVESWWKRARRIANDSRSRLEGDA